MGDSKCKATVPVEKSCALHLGSVTRPSNMGRGFSTESAPGLVFGVGSVGPFLEPYPSCDTFFSLDGGLSWKLAAKGAHKFESVDSGGVFFMVPDYEPTDIVKYSLDRGSTWKTLKVELGGGKWRPRFTMLDPDSTSLHVLLYASTESGQNFIVQFDFEGSFSRKCVIDRGKPEDSTDFELWDVRGVNKEECFLGQDIGFYRRKADVDCFVGSDFKEAVKTVKSCECIKSDYECDLYWKPDSTGAELKCSPDDEGSNSDQVLISLYLICIAL